MGYPHKLNFIKTELRHLCFEEPAPILPRLGTDDGVLRIDSPTSLQRSFIVSGQVQITSLGERLRLQKSSILAQINKESWLPAFKKLNLLTSSCLYIFETTVFFK